MSQLRVWLLSGIVVAGLASAAQAQGGYCPSPYYGAGYYYLYGRDYIPYYALHPPVYYSYPVPRTYGYSPFAYPPGVMTPELELGPEEVEGKVMHNPYVPQAPEPKAASKRSASAPQRITNPFVQVSVRTASAQ